MKVEFLIHNRISSGIIFMPSVGGFDDRFEIGVGWGPGELGLEARGVGDELVGVAGAAGDIFDLNF